MLITHDLGVVADHADEVVVMYAGRVAERAPAAAIFARPQHPYTVGLLGAAPRLEGGATRLASIEGTVPDLRAPPPGCRFSPRCPFAIARCAEAPPLAPVGEGHVAACWRAPLDSLLAAA
jgi:peptide/nickel transport system ATP-binding protein